MEPFQVITALRSVVFDPRLQVMKLASAPLHVPFMMRMPFESGSTCGIAIGVVMLAPDSTVKGLFERGLLQTRNRFVALVGYAVVELHTSTFCLSLLTPAASFV